MYRYKHKHYVPILKWRQAEQESLKEVLTPEGSMIPPKIKITPLIEIPPIAWDFINEKPAKTIDQHLSKVPEKLLKTWKSSLPIYLDMSLILPDERMKDGRHPLEYLFGEVRSRGGKIIPVTGLSRDDAYQKAVRGVIFSEQSGVCMRLKDEEFENDDLEINLRRTLISLGVKKDSDVDIVLDYADITGENIRRLIRSIIGTIGEVDRIGKWRTLTFAASSFPRDLSAIPSNTSEVIPRKEWEAWKSIISSGVPRKPSFGDYAIQHPEPVEVDPRIMMMSASVRYTIENEWLILKAKSVRRHGSEQYHQICKALVSDPRYYGEMFSWGDYQIWKCAKKLTGPGNATTWRKVGTSHHFNVVSSQISSFS